MKLNCRWKATRMETAQGLRVLSAEVNATEWSIELGMKSALMSAIRRPLVLSEERLHHRRVRGGLIAGPVGGEKAESSSAGRIELNTVLSVDLVGGS